MEKFSYGKEFYRLNEALWKIYSECADGEQVLKAQNEYLKRIDEEDAEMRKIDPLKLLASESDSISESDLVESERLTDAFGNWIV